jgi:tRNA-dihydrouridine synthase B
VKEDLSSLFGGLPPERTLILMKTDYSKIEKRKCIDDAVEMLEKTNCDAIMIGRGGLGNPWLFKQIDHYLKTGVRLEEPTVFDRLDMCIRHARELCNIMDEKVAIKEMRTHACYYIKGLPNSCLLKNEINKLEDYKSFEMLINNYKKELEVL